VSVTLTEPVWSVLASENFTVTEFTRSAASRRPSSPQSTTLVSSKIGNVSGS